MFNLFQKIDEFSLRTRDKIFIFLAIFGLLASLWFSFFGSVDNQFGEWKKFEPAFYYFLNDEEILDCKLNNKEFQMEVAKSEEKRIQGLSNRKNLPDNFGMIFLFKKNDQFSFRMKEMQFDLDFIFINKGIVVDVKENISSNFTDLISGKKSYDAVIEIQSGWIEKNNIEIGDQLFIKN